MTFDFKCSKVTELTETSPYRKYIILSPAADTAESHPHLQEFTFVLDADSPDYNYFVIDATYHIELT